MKLFQITVRNRVTNRCIQSIEIYAADQRMAVKNAIKHYPEYTRSNVYRVSVRVLRESFTRMRVKNVNR